VPAVPVPTSALLSWVWTAWVIELDNEFEAQCTERVGQLFRISYAMWANGLRLVDEDGITVADLQRRAGAGCNLPGLERWGWITLGDANEPRAGFGSSRGVRAHTVVRPTRAGRFARREWPRVLDTVEQRWNTRFGTPTLDALRARLRESLAVVPWGVPEVAAANGFRTLLVDTDASTDDDGSLIVLLSRALTDLTVQHERDATVSLPLGANVLRVIGEGADAGARVRDLPERAGISKEAAAMSSSFLTRHRLAATGADRTVALTPKGIAALADWVARSAAQGHDALRSELEGMLVNTDALRAALTPPADGWRAQKPYLARTRRLLADPGAALPWQPMVLHRGGWPDGS
jgi:hypothetical protein